MPAIDLKDGKCVRLYQGDYTKETVFSDDPLEIALRWQAMGAPWLHIVDLDGAIQGKLVNLDIIQQIATAALVPIQVGGGIRELQTVKELLKMGVEQVILSTAAVEDPRLIAEVCRTFSESITVSIDTRDGWVTTHGWQQETRLTAIEFTQSMIQLGVKRFIYTDIRRDGTLTEPNFTAFAELLSAVGLPVIVSGGVSSLIHITMLKQLGAEAAIIGKALYTGDINLKEALTVISS
ncbi:MAG: 1-(5-phosphoribosyl)-5-[(5-phosphoribosylamino)methylideneamino]imidazole-4-carboxamide isomerase [Dehalococcoidales bacterium]|nr:1-(5-phosphoribosyl)-5-[(5-phosphoribosylamino)methylideneamino]imidazole-4-carboxamide isomerase [Dehalococcoidales bacterium]MDP7409523.1 1-(5-phosphoribosyl)-5-[(5-phosphoribosylamino)methylideneamino]imidazole-4-carboxamide isomerase [Dehalococcoidales bacterium]MDP7675858.1 1-(5-phosphoribosyl)-5-[(5-phosphoribosylamino)methylideneamino]imidazole-4-carboxamide isomerase [Dehalococcoidales bacterium]HJM36585.1 1-(5-phosphoribosyl)-5-[(5-phosphoribosylamino)methylideneamino]imidazole-4-car